MGIGYIIAIPEAETKNAISTLNAAGVDSFVIGNIERRRSWRKICMGMRFLLKKAFTPITIMVIPHSSRKTV